MNENGEVIPPSATLHFVGWVEPTPGFVGFRCTQPNLHFAVVIAKCETQQLPISIKLAVFLTSGDAYMKLHEIEKANRRMSNDE